MTASLIVQRLGVTSIGATPHRVLDDVSFSLEPGASVGIVGRSGAGKSTIGNAILDVLPRGLRRDLRSQITLGADNLTALDAEAMRAVRGKRIAMVFQEPLSALDPAMRVGRQLTAALEAHGVASGAVAMDRAIAMLDRVGIRDAARSARRFPHELSGGQRQRMLLALALMLEPEVLIADEPTTALDVTLQAQLLDLLDDLRRDVGTTLLLISHDLAVVGERCARVLVLEHGRLVDDGPAERIVAARLATASGAAAVARARAVRPADPDGSPPDVPLVACSNLQVHYRTPARLFRRPEAAVRALETVDLAIGRGECVGLVGESGCGKSTLARALLGLELPTAGTVTVLGRRLEVRDRVMMRALRRRLQLVPQDAGASLTPQRRVRSLLVEALVVHGHTPGVPAQRRAEQLLEDVGLDPALGARRPGTLSSGERQRVAIARALAPQPDLLVCDEPVANLDAAAREPLLALLDRLRTARGLALLLISHDLGVVRRLAARVAVMYLGRIVEQGNAAAVLDAPVMPYTQLLHEAVPTGRPRRMHAPGGELPQPFAVPAQGCPFHPRCTHPLKDEGCMSERPELRASVDGPDGHLVACLKVPLLRIP
jgi:peptide/nickel transport system ATP-binding protein